MGIEPGWHLRRGTSTRGKAEQAPWLFHGYDMKCHGKPSMSTFALMAFMPVWSAGSSRQDKELAAAWESVLRALLGRVYAHGSCYHWLLRDDSGASCKDGFLRGANVIELTISNGVIAWQEPPLPTRLWNKHFKDRDWETEVTVADFAIHSQKHGLSMSWLALQVAQLLACDIEDYVREQTDPAQAEQRPITLNRRQKREWLRGRLSRLALAIKPPTKLDMVRDVLRHWIAARSHECRHAQHLCLALDASRTGNRSRMFGFLTAGNKGFWCPPLVRGEKNPPQEKKRPNSSPLRALATCSIAQHCSFSSAQH
eukprot:6492096-Amphidinium_carterae.1